MCRPAPRRRRLRLVPILIALGLAGSYAPAQGPPPDQPVVKPIVEVRTSLGTFTLELWPEVAPATVQNFVTLAQAGAYDGTIFHRVVKGFVIQGGGYTPDLAKRPRRAPVPLEAREPNRRYTIAMARTPDPDSATSEFFINLRDNASLDPAVRPPGYAVFGRVIRGAEVVDQIAQVPRAPVEGFEFLPATAVVIQRVVVTGP